MDGPSGAGEMDGPSRPHAGVSAAARPSQADNRRRPLSLAWRRQRSGHAEPERLVNRQTPANTASANGSPAAPSSAIHTTTGAAETPQLPQSLRQPRQSPTAGSKQPRRACSKPRVALGPASPNISPPGHSSDKVPAFDDCCSPCRRPLLEVPLEEPQRRPQPDDARKQRKRRRLGASSGSCDALVPSSGSLPLLERSEPLSQAPCESWLPEPSVRSDGGIAAASNPLHTSEPPRASLPTRSVPPPLPIRRLPADSPLLAPLDATIGAAVDSPPADGLGACSSSSSLTAAHLARMRAGLLAGSHELLPDDALQEVESLVGAMPVGLAMAYHEMGVSIARLAAELPHAVRAHIGHAGMCYEFSSRILHPPILRISPRPARCFSILFGGHFPSRHSAGVGYHYRNGHAGDPTTAYLERSITEALHLTDYSVFADQIDVAVDFFGAPTDHYVPRCDGGGTQPFSAQKHFFDTLAPDERATYRQAHVEAVAGRLQDEIEFGRNEGWLFLCGKVAHDETRHIVEEAALLVKARTGKTFTIRIPDGLPPPAPTKAERGLAQLDHICMALDNKMSVEERRRWDAVLTCVLQRVAPSIPTVTYFRSMGQSSGALMGKELVGLRRTATARAGGYVGRCPLQHQLTEDERVQFDAALREEHSCRNAKRETSVARAAGYVGSCPLERALNDEEQAEFEEALRKGLSHRNTLREIQAALSNGYLGPNPLEEELTADEQASFDAHLRAELSLRSVHGIDARRAAAARAGGFVEPSSLRGTLDPVQQAAFDAAVDVEFVRRRRKARTALARAGGYVGPCPLTGALSAELQAAFDRGLAIETSRIANLGADKRLVTLARSVGYIGRCPLTGTLSDADRAECAEATRVWVLNGIAKRLPGGYHGPRARLRQERPKALKAAVVHVGRLQYAKRGGYTGTGPALDDEGSDDWQAAVEAGASHAAMLPRKARRKDARPAQNTGPPRPEDPMVWHQCKKCKQGFGVKTLHSVTGEPWKNGNPRHLQCELGWSSSTSVCWGGKRTDNRPACPGCWPFGRASPARPGQRIPEIPPPRQAAAAAERAAAAACADVEILEAAAIEAEAAAALSATLGSKRAAQVAREAADEARIRAAALKKASKWAAARASEAGSTGYTRPG